MNFYDIIRELITGREGTRAAEIHEAIDKHEAEHNQAAGNNAPETTPAPDDQAETTPASDTQAGNQAETAPAGNEEEA